MTEPSILSPTVGINLNPPPTPVYDAFLGELEYDSTLIDDAVERITLRASRLPANQRNQFVNEARREALLLHNDLLKMQTLGSKPDELFSKAVEKMYQIEKSMNSVIDAQLKLASTHSQQSAQIERFCVKTASLNTYHVTASPKQLPTRGNAFANTLSKHKVIPLSTNPVVVLRTRIDQLRKVNTEDGRIASSRMLGVYLKNTNTYSHLTEVECNQLAYYLIKGSINESDSKNTAKFFEDRLREKKAEVTLCARVALDSPSLLQSEKCVAQVLLTATVEEQKQLKSFVPKAHGGAALDVLMGPFVAVSKVTGLVMGVYNRGAIEQSCTFQHKGDLRAQQICVKEQMAVMAGQDKRLNQRLKSETPQPVLDVARAIKTGLAYVDSADVYMHTNWGTELSLKDTLHGVTDVTLPIVAKGVIRGAVHIARSAPAFLARDLPGFCTTFLKDEAGCIVLPTVQSTSDKISKIVKGLRHPNTPTHLNVERVMVEDYIPHYGHTQDAVGNFINATFPERPIIKAWQQAGQRTNYVHLYEVNDKPMAFVKDFIHTNELEYGFLPEIQGYHAVAARNHTHSTTPKILNVGQYNLFGVERGLIMFEYVPYQSVRTLIGRNIIEIDMRQIGRALGEYHSFTLGEGVSTDYALLQARRTHFFAESAFSLLDTRKIPIRFGMREVDLLTKDMIRNPGKATFVHGDFHAGNVLTEGKNIPVIIDHELLPRFLRLDGTPQGMPALDLNEFLFPLKYVYPKENKHLSSEFLGGYREICNLPITGEANLYSHVHVELANLHGMMMNNQNINVIMQVVDHLNTILARPG